MATVDAILSQQEVDLRKIVTVLNEAQHYRQATQVQGMLNTLANTYISIKTHDVEDILETEVG